MMSSSGSSLTFEARDWSPCWSRRSPAGATPGGSRRTSFTSDTTAGALAAADLAAMIVPGGYAPDRLRMRHALLDLVRHAIAAGVPVGAIGHGAQVLISAAHCRTHHDVLAIHRDRRQECRGLVCRSPGRGRPRASSPRRKTDDVVPFVDAVLAAIGRAALTLGRDTIPACMETSPSRPAVLPVTSAAFAPLTA